MRLSGSVLTAIAGSTQQTMEISTDFPVVVSEEQTVLTTVLVRIIYDERSQGLIEPLNTYL
jgi:hypothetical protein